MLSEPCFASQYDSDSLQELWQTCFDEDPEVTEYFFKELFIPENTLIIKYNNKAVSVLYLLPCSIIQNTDKSEKEFPGYYIYSVATHPDFRKRQLASKLLNFANSTATDRGKVFTFLVPSEASLFSFYEKNNFTETLYIRKVKKTLSALKQLSKNIDISDYMFDSKNSDFYKLRNSFFSQSAFFIKYPINYLRFSVFLTEHYEGKLLIFHKKYRQGYAFCDKISNNVEVKELVLENNDFAVLAAKLTASFSESDYVCFCLPVDGNILPDEGEIFPFGLMHSIINNDIGKNKIYPGLVLN